MARLRCERAIAFLKAAAGDAVELDAEALPVLHELGDGLLVSYVVEQGDQFEFISEGEMVEEGFTADRLHQVGLANLAELVGAQGVQVHPDEAIFAVVAGGNFEASLILIDDLWQSGFRQFVDGDYAVAIPARDILAFGDAGNAAARSALRDVIRRAWLGADHLLSNRLFTRQGGAWKALD